MSHNKPVETPMGEQGVTGYNAVCSVNLGITLAVFAVLYVALGIAELCLPHFPTAGAILYVPIVLVIAAVFGILAGKRLTRDCVLGGLTTYTLAAAVAGITIVGLLTRMIIVLLIIPIANSEISYDYVYEHTYFPNGTIAAYDEDPERIPRPHTLVDYDATGVVMGLELVLAIAALVLSTIGACLGCRPICCPRQQQGAIRQEDGTFLNVNYTAP